MIELPKDVRPEAISAIELQYWKKFDKTPSRRK
jgi:hypothetical protein